MDIFLVRISAGEAVNLVNGGAVEVVIEAAEAAPDRLLLLGEAWAGLHFLLSGEVPTLKYDALRRGISWSDDSLENVLMGGEPTGYESAFGLARCVVPAEVAVLSRKISDISADQLAAWYAPDALAEYSIPPPVWHRGEQPLAWLQKSFQQLQRFYRQAADAGQGLLVYFS